MPGRSTLLIAGLASAVALPYVTSPSTGLRQWITTPAANEESFTSSPQASPGAAAAVPNAASALHPEGSPVQDLSEVFRFDIPPGWVLARWPRVNTRLASLDLSGYRVALVTGIKENDLAGSLTYYFNPQQRVQRITFIGKTGDPSPLVSYLSTRYQFERRVVDDPTLALYQVKKGKKTISEMRIRPVSTITRDDTHSRFEVALVIERP